MTISTQCRTLHQNVIQGTTYTIKSNDKKLQNDHKNDTISVPDLQKYTIEHGKRGQFKQAQVYATQLINSTPPMNLHGYLLSGDLYFYQGYQSSAMEIYDRGMDQYRMMVHITTATNDERSNKNDTNNTAFVSQPQYQLLYDRYQTAKMAHEKRIDFVNTLGCIDATALIFKHLLTQQNKPHGLDHDHAVLETTLVCKSWRDFALFQVPALWRYASCWSFMKKINPTFRLLHHPSGISHHVRQLALTDISLNTCNTLIELVQSGKLDHVKGLKYITGTEEQKLLDMSMVLVLSLNKNLTALFINEIHVVHDIDDVGVPLGKILSTCLSLRHLSILTNRTVHYDIISNNDNDLESQSTSSTTATLSSKTVTNYNDHYYYGLRTFVIRCRGTLDRILEDIVSRSPKLRAFSTANGCSSSRMLTQLDRSCPKLKIFYITPEPHEKIKLDEIMDGDEDGEGDHCYYHHSTDIISNNNGKQKEGGLEILGVDRLVIFEPRDLMPFFQKNQNTLRTLELELSDPQRTKVQDWAPLATMGPFPNIKRLFYSSSDRLGDADPIAVPLIERCPALEMIEFEYIDHVTLQAIHSLMALRHLRYLSITNSDMSRTIQAFFEHHARLGVASSLEKVSLVYAHPLTDAILDALAGIMTLKKITIRGSSQGVTKQGVESFIRKYASHSNVDNIQLSQLRQVSFVDIRQMLSVYKNQEPHP
ncbi:hypothetical protein BDA99DRAFT_496726, partial [Phascolomyces articulosus]